MPVPGTIRENEVLVRVQYASICGTDLHIYQWNRWAQNRIKLPQVAGHEFSGVVVATGKNVQRIREGDFVSAETHIPCKICPQCRTGKMHICRNMEILGVDRDGIFAPYAVVPEIVLWKNDPSIAPQFASVQEPLGNAVFTVKEADVAGKSVLITGAGPIGAMAIQVARAMGAGPIIVSEIKPFRLELAQKNGADFVIDPAQQDALARILEITDGNGVEAVLEMSGNQKAMQLGLDALTPGGTVSILGVFDDRIPFDINQAVFKNLTLKGITGRKMFETWFTLSSLLKYGRVSLDKIVTHVLPFESWQQGFDLMEEGKCGKVVLQVSN